jgi:hypothetical protein
LASAREQEYLIQLAADLQAAEDMLAAAAVLNAPREHTVRQLDAVVEKRGLLLITR